MYIIEIKYKGNAIEDQVALHKITDYVPTLTYQNSYSVKRNQTTLCWVFAKLSRVMIMEIYNVLPYCDIEITELIKGKQSSNVDDFF